MTAADLLFEPFNLPTTTGTAPAPTGTASSTGIIMVSGNYTRVDIQRTQSRQLYTDTAIAVMDAAALHHPTMFDVRHSRHLLPNGFLTLVDMVDRFHDGLDSFWIARPQAMQPQLFKFEGRFGHFKFMRMPQQFIPSVTTHWFWIDTDAGQLAAIDLGVLMMDKKLKLYHAFINQADALSYYTS